MSKNLIPIFIVLGVMAVLFVGVSVLSNPNKVKPDPFNSLPTLNPTSIPTPEISQASAIISTTPAQIKNTTNMDNFTTTADGLKFFDEITGVGVQANSGNTVTVNYLGTLENGTKFDSSYDRKTPFTTQIGVGQVIKGWDEGIVGMKVGGKRKLIIPPNLGYGSQNLGSIPPNSTLIFEVELLDVK